MNSSQQDAAITTRHQRPLLVVGEDGFFYAQSTGAIEAINERGVGRRLKRCQALVFEKPTDAFSPSFRSRAFLDQFSEWLPRFVVLDATDGDAARAVIETFTIFDRLVVRGGLIDTIPDVYQLGVAEGASRDEIVAAVFDDLGGDTASQVSVGTDYAAENYWEDRAQMDAVLGRKVCYESAPRVFNKIMHAEQVVYLLPALRNAVAAAHPVGSRPNLLHYGCGVGRLDRMCAPYVNNYGVDISPTMVKLASALHPNSTYRVTSELDGADFPKMDAVMIVTVLHHNPPAARRAIYAQCARVSQRHMRLILLEDFIAPNAMTHNLYPLRIGDLLDEIAEGFGGSCTLAGMNLLGYKPRDYLQRSVLLELDIDR